MLLLGPFKSSKGLFPEILFGAEIEVAATFYSDPEPSKVKELRLRNRCNISTFSKGNIDTLYIEI